MNSPAPRSRTRWGIGTKWTVTLQVVLVAVLLLGCSGDDDISGPRPPTPVYPLHHEAPDWSRQGLIAYEDHGVVCVRPSGGVSVDTSLAGIWVLDQDLGEKWRILPFGGIPDWSPDGTRLAFVIGTQIHVVNTDGTGLQQLTFQGASFFPNWSPDGQLIVYDSNLDSEGFYIWIMHADGSGKQRLSEGVGRMPTWTADGSGITYKGIIQVGDAIFRELFVMEADGSNPVRLTHSEEEERYPQYSPDGEQIAFTLLESGELPQIWAMNANATDLRQVTTRGGSHPSWSPDGSRIVFVRENPWERTPESNVLWVVDVNSGDQYQLTTQWPEQCPEATGEGGGLSAAKVGAP